MKTEFINKSAHNFEFLIEGRRYMLYAGKILPPKLYPGKVDVIATGGRGSSTRSHGYDQRQEEEREPQVYENRLTLDTKNSDFAPYSRIEYLEDGQVALTPRKFYRKPKLEFPCVEFLFISKCGNTKRRLLIDASKEPVEAVTLYHGIPVRRSVGIFSEFAQYERWLVEDWKERLKVDEEKPWLEMTKIHISQHGEQRRSKQDLQKLEDLKVEKESSLAWRKLIHG